MSGWDFEASTSGGQQTEKKAFTRFPTGVTKIRVLDDAPHMRWIHWMNQFGRSITCPGNCPIDKIRKREKEAGVDYTYSMQRKFSMNIFNHGTEQLEIMDEGITFMEDLRDIMEELKEDGHDLSDAILKVRRRAGDGGKASYRIDVDQITPMSDEEKEALSNRTDFKEYFKPATVEQIQQLLEVTENHKERFVEIMSGAENSSNDVEEDIETE